MHGALLHHFIHRSEDITLIDDLREDALVQFVEVEGVDEGLLENLVAHRRRSHVEVFELRLVVLTHTELVDED